MRAGIFVCSGIGILPCGRFGDCGFSGLGVQCVIRYFRLGSSGTGIVLTVGRFGTGADNVSGGSNRKNSTSHEIVRTHRYLGMCGRLITCCRSASILILNSLGDCNVRSTVGIFASTKCVGLLGGCSPTT